MNEEAMRAGRLCELAERSYSNNYYTYTEFLGLADISLLQRLARNDERMRGIKYTMYGGHDDAERLVAAFGDEEEFGYKPSFPIACLLVKPRNAKFADKLTHRDYLGAVMNLGIGREQIGDIIIKDNKGYIFCLDTMAEYIISGLDKIKHTNVLCELTEELPDVEDNLKELTVMVPSERIDVITAKVYKLSRSVTSNLINQKKLYINGNLCESPGHVLKPSDVISVRGYGRFRYSGIVSSTGKGKYIVGILINQV